VQGEPDNSELEEELRRVVAQVDSVPLVVLEEAVDAFAWRTIDADLAELVFDSLVDRDKAALVRGTGTEHGRMLSFRSSSLTIEVEVTGTRASRRLVGQLVPPQRGSVDVRHRDSVVTVEADELGRFSVGSLPAGPISLRCRPDSATVQHPVVTDWVTM
jgi:hypothetical protein